jgi:hypothetical protein
MVMREQLTERAFIGSAGMSGPSAAYGRWIQESGAGEWFVLAHLGFFFILLACFGWAAWGIWRRTTRPAPHLQLLMEMATGELEGSKEGESKAGGEGDRDLRPWERSEDWWKKER